MIKIEIAPALVARSLRASDAPIVFELIRRNRVYLDRWLRWSSTLQSVDDVTTFIDQFTAKENLGGGFHLGVFAEDQLVGGVVCWYINRASNNAEVGYWLGEEHTGNGYATRATLRVVDYLFAEESVHRVEMQCGTSNSSSRGVAERCGLRMEGIRRESHWITNRYVDHAIYGKLRSD